MRRVSRDGFIFAVPFVITVCFIGYSLRRDAGVGAGDEIAFTRDPTRLVVLGFAYSLACILAIYRFDRTLRLLVRHWALILFLAFIGMSAFWSAFPSKVIVNTGHYVGFFLVCLVACWYFSERERQLFAVVAISMSAVVAISIIVALGFPAIGTDVIYGRWQGITGNPNTLGLACSLGLWASLSLFLSGPGRTRPWRWLTLIPICVAGLIGSGSMTSMIISLFVALALPALLFLDERSFGARFFALGAALFVVCVSAICIYLIYPESFGVDATLAIFGRERTLTGRLDLWKYGFELISDKPWHGWGFDSLASALSVSELQTGQLHNGYIDLCVRGGIIALAFLTWMILGMLRNAVALSKFNYRVAACWVVLAVAILLHNLTEASLVRTTHAYWLMFLMTYLYIDYLVGHPVKVAAPRSSRPLPNLLGRKD